MAAALDQTFEREISANRDHSARTGACAHWIAKRAVSNSSMASRAQAGRRSALAGRALRESADVSEPLQDCIQL